MRFRSHPANLSEYASKRRISSFLAIAVFLASFTNGHSVLAGESVQTIDEASPSSQSTDSPYGLAGDLEGYRKKIEDNGIDLNAVEILDFLGNPTGGTTQGTVIQGVFQPTLDVDFGKLADINGLTAHASAFQVHGRGMSVSDLNNNIATSTGIEADRATRLFELWVQKTLYGGDLSVRAGQLAADQEFITTQYGALFMNSVYGWPSSIATNLPGGGPGYPLATPGVRVRIGQTDPWAAQIAVFDGDPSGGPGNGTAQSHNPSGTKFPLNHYALVMTEVDYGNQGDGVDLSGTYKVGMWYHTGTFADQRYGTDGLSLANLSSNGIAKTHHGNYGFYGVIDQTLWHPADSKDKALSGFMRLLWNPDDRNTVAYQLDVGLNLLGMIPERDNDIVGLAFAYLPITDSASGLDQDTNAFNSTNAPLRNYESQIELTYQAQISPWLTVQPEFQYVFHPGGNLANPNDVSGTKPVGDAAILGVRAIVRF